MTTRKEHNEKKIQNSRFYVERKEELIHLRQIGYTYEEIGEEFGITRQRVYQIVGDENSAVIRRIKQRERRRYVLERFGNVCNICGFSDWRALQIDHINGGGKQEVKQIGSNAAFYKILVDMPTKELKSKYQVLCANCNWIKRYENNEIKSKDGISIAPT